MTTAEESLKSSPPGCSSDPSRWLEYMLVLFQKQNEKTSNPMGKRWATAPFVRFCSCLFVFIGCKFSSCIAEAEGKSVWPTRCWRSIAKKTPNSCKNSWQSAHQRWSRTAENKTALAESQTPRNKFSPYSQNCLAPVSSKEPSEGNVTVSGWGDVLNLRPLWCRRAPTCPEVDTSVYFDCG